MKVFQIIAERCSEKDGSKEIIEQVSYATSKSDSIVEVVKHYVDRYKGYGIDLKSITEVLTVTGETK